jgi:hypothetical protein
MMTPIMQSLHHVVESVEAMRLLETIEASQRSLVLREAMRLIKRQSSWASFSMLPLLSKVFGQGIWTRGFCFLRVYFEVLEALIAGMAYQGLVGYGLVGRSPAHFHIWGSLPDGGYQKGDTGSPWIQAYPSMS